jgi:hypothetical protein
MSTVVWIFRASEQQYTRAAVRTLWHGVLLERFNITLEVENRLAAWVL